MSKKELIEALDMITDVPCEGGCFTCPYSFTEKAICFKLGAYEVLGKVKKQLPEDEDE